MTDNHPITPPLELREQWKQQWLNGAARNIDLATYIAIQAYRAGADQELEACREWLNRHRWPALAIHLRDARRPKPPSLKEQALGELENMIKAAKDFGFGGTDPQAIRKVLEQLDD